MEAVVCSSALSRLNLDRLLYSGTDNVMVNFNFKVINLTDIVIFNQLYVNNYKFIKQIKSAVNDGLNKAMKNYKENVTNSETEQINYLQQQVIT